MKIVCISIALVVTLASGNTLYLPSSKTLSTHHTACLHNIMSDRGRWENKDISEQEMSFVMDYLK